MSTNPKGWDRAVSWEQRVAKLCQLGMMDSPEFETHKRIYGRDKLVDVYKRWKAGHIPIRDTANEETDPVPDSGSSSPKATQKGAKVKSFVEKSCPDDDF